MTSYIIRRLLLLPLTLFCIILVNFVIINLSPGEPTSITEISKEGEAAKRSGAANVSDDRYLQFREFYGLTLPILFNHWVYLTEVDVQNTLSQLVTRRYHPTDVSEMSAKDYDAIRIKMGDEARFIMPYLKQVMNNSKLDLPLRKMAARFFIRGGQQMAFLGSNLSDERRAFNQKINIDNSFLKSLSPTPEMNLQTFQENVRLLTNWYENNTANYPFEMTRSEKIKTFFFQTRFFRYMSRVLTLDFGSIRNDENKLVITEVTKRFKYSLTLSLIPMLITFVVCQIFGFIMALKRGKLPDLTLNLICLILYAIPVFVVAPFLIEKVALNGYFPFTHIPIPYSGFTSPDNIYNNMTSLERLFDVITHIFLPIVAIIYGSIAAQSRLSRTAVLEVMRQDYVRTAYAKGVAPFTVWWKHIGKNASITIVTSIAGSLGIILGGSLIVETLFEIDGFGKFFYDAVVNRDYNVIMFSAIAGSFLTLVGYLLADIAYTLLDPRVTLE